MGDKKGSSMWKYVAPTVMVLQLGLTAVWVLGSNGGGGWLWGSPTGLAAVTSPDQEEHMYMQAALAGMESRLAARMDWVEALPIPIASMDVNRLLSLAPPGNESERLEKMLYCNRFGNLSREVEALPPWEPPGDTFLLPLCNYGQMSNRMKCMRTTLLLAVLLNRTMLVPERETGALGYPYWLVFDVPHARSCVGGGRNKFLTVEEYRKELLAKAPAGGPGQQRKVKVDRLLAFFEDESPWVGDYYKLWNSGTVEVTKHRESLPAGVHRVESAKEWLLLAGAVRDPVISPGDTFNLFFHQPNGWPDLPRDAVLRPNLPVRGLSCKLLVQPHPAIVMAAKGFVRTVLGADFLAIHLRRQSFHQHWNGRECRATGAGNQNCRLRPIHLVAACIREKLRGTNISVVFAAANTFPTEMKLLRTLLAPAALVTLPTSFLDEPYNWAQPWNDRKMHAEPMALAALDKMVCAMAKIFLGTLWSTFSEDIAAMRAALGTMSCHDQDLGAPFVYDTDPLPFFNLTDPADNSAFR